MSKEKYPGAQGPQDNDYKQLFDEFEEQTLQGEVWKEIFGEEISGSLAEEMGLNEPPPAQSLSPEEGETFPIDESYFNTGGLSLDDTAVIPPEVSDLSAYIEEGEEEEEFELEEAGPIRRNRRRRTGFLGGIMYAAFILGLGTILAFLAWMAVDDMFALTREEFTVEITIPEDFTLEDVANELHAQGLISHPRLFRLMGNVFNYSERIQPGVYMVSTMDYRALIGRLNQRTGEMIEVTVMIPEGRMMREIFQILENNGVASAESLHYAAENGDFDFEFLNVLPADTMNRLEGYLFPDTYIFFLGQNPESVIRTMLRNFQVRMAQNNVSDLVENSQFSLHEIINIAAMIEGEMANWAEAPRISSVIHNRIRDGWHLNIDATIQYILPERVEFLTTIGPNAHTQIQSPYNTYLITGLPYGPVANPGMASILAALQPETTDFFFYALHVDGHHHFTRTYAEHNAFINSPNFVHYGW